MGPSVSEKEMVSLVEGMELEFGQVEFPLGLTGGTRNGNKKIAWPKYLSATKVA